MDKYFSESYMTGVNMLLGIVQEVAYIIGAVVVGVYYINALNQVRKQGSYNMISVLPVLLKPTLVFMLIITFSEWTNLLGGAIHAIPGYIQGRYIEKDAEIRKQFVDENGNQVDPWLHYQNLASKIRNQKMNSIQQLIRDEKQIKADLTLRMEKAETQAEKEVIQAQMDEISKSLEYERRKLHDETPSYLGEKLRNGVMAMFRWLVDGSYFIIIMVLKKIQESLLAFIMATGVLSLLWSLIPGQEGSFDKWLSYFFSVQLWTVTMVIVNVYYQASIIGSIKEMESVLTKMDTGVIPDQSFFSITVDYVANCVSYIIIFMSVPGLVQIYMAKSGGSEMFSRFIQQASAGTALVSGSISKVAMKFK